MKADTQRIVHKHSVTGELELGRSTLGEKFGGMMLFCQLVHNVSDARVDTMNAFTRLARKALNEWTELAGQLKPETEAEAYMAQMDIIQRDTKIIQQILGKTKAFRSEAQSILTETQPGGKSSWKDPAVAGYVLNNKFWKGLDRFEFMLLQYSMGAAATGPKELQRWTVGLDKELSKAETVASQLEKRRPAERI